MRYERLYLLASLALRVVRKEQYRVPVLLVYYFLENVSDANFLVSPVFEKSLNLPPECVFYLLRSPACY